MTSTLWGIGMSECFFYGDDGSCGLGQYGGAPNEEDCKSCMHYSGKSRGLGDKVSNVIEAVGMKKVLSRVKGNDCGCGKRRAALNRMFPSKEKP